VDWGRGRGHNSLPPNRPNATLENMTRGTRLSLWKLDARIFAEELTTTYGRLLMVPIKNSATQSLSLSSLLAAMLHELHTSALY
jgi:hypothetical protein